VPAAARLFPDEASAEPAAAKPTLESLFGPDVGAKSEETLSAAQVFGDEPAAAPEQGQESSKPEGEE